MLCPVARVAPHMEEINAAPDELLNRDVQIIGLLRAPHYNGRVGVAYAFDVDEGGLHRNLQARGRNRERERTILVARVWFSIA